MGRTNNPCGGTAGPGHGGAAHRTNRASRCQGLHGGAPRLAPPVRRPRRQDSPGSSCRPATMVRPVPIELQAGWLLHLARLLLRLPELGPSTSAGDVGPGRALPHAGTAPCHPCPRPPSLRQSPAWPPSRSRARQRPVNLLCRPRSPRCWPMRCWPTRSSPTPPQPRQPRQILPPPVSWPRHPWPGPRLPWMHRSSMHVPGWRRSPRNLRRAR